MPLQLTRSEDSTTGKMYFFWWWYCNYCMKRVSQLTNKKIQFYEGYWEGRHLASIDCILHQEECVKKNDSAVLMDNSALIKKHRNVMRARGLKWKKGTLEQEIDGETTRKRNKKN